MRKLLISVVVFAAGIAAAQDAVPPASGNADAATEKMLADAQAVAARPGDEDLTCEQLQAEHAAGTTDPQLLAVAQQQGAFAQAQMAKVAQAQEEADKASSGPGIFGQTVRGLAGGLIPRNPVTARAQRAEQEAKNAEMMAQAQNNNAAMMAQFGQLTGVMPQMARNARVVQLAKARNCEWLGEMPAP